MKKYQNTQHKTEPWNEAELVEFKGYKLTYEADRYGNLIRVHLPGNQSLPYRTLRVLGADAPREVRT